MRLHIQQQTHTAGDGLSSHSGTSKRVLVTEMPAGGITSLGMR